MKKQHNCVQKIHMLAILVLLPLVLAACTGKTAPAPPPEEQPFVFLFMSDTQADPQTGDYSGVGELFARAIANESQPELVILGGDTVNDGVDKEEWRNFWQAAATPLAGLAVAAAAGNHDGNALLAEQFTWPNVPPAQPRQGYFYSFDMKGVHFTVLDSNIMGAANPEDIAWLEDDLSSETAQQAAWRIAVCHHPLWPLSAIPKDEARAQTMREYFLPLLQEYNVDMLLVGHQHIYSRSLPMQGGQPAAQGLVQVMAASGGKGSYTPEERDYLAFSAQAPNYVLFAATAATLTLTAYDGSGNIIDTYALIRGD